MTSSKLFISDIVTMDDFLYKLILGICRSRSAEGAGSGGGKTAEGWEEEGSRRTAQDYTDREITSW